MNEQMDPTIWDVLALVQLSWWTKEVELSLQPTTQWQMQEIFRFICPAPVFLDYKMCSYIHQSVVCILVLNIGCFSKYK